MHAIRVPFSEVLDPEAGMNTNSDRTVGEAGFLSEVMALRARARDQIVRGEPKTVHGIDPGLTIDLLNTALAAEMKCVLRFRQHALAASGIRAEPIAAGFLFHAIEELGHADQLAKCIVQLGGVPRMDPAGPVGERSHARYFTCDGPEAMIRESLAAERIAIENYRDMIDFVGDRSPATRSMLEGILAAEEEHADELAGLLA